MPGATTMVLRVLLSSTSRRLTIVGLSIALAALFFVYGSPGDLSASSLVCLAGPCSTAARPYDVVIFGTGFVANLYASSLIGRREAFISISPGMRLNSGVAGLRIALAGRNMTKLNILRSSLGASAAGWGVMVADVQDSASLEQLALQSRVILSTVAEDEATLYLLRLCAEHGTSLIDIAGWWASNGILRAEVDAAARKSGAVICPLAGYVSAIADALVYKGWTDIAKKPLRNAWVYSLYFNGEELPLAKDGSNLVKTGPRGEDLGGVEMLGINDGRKIKNPFPTPVQKAYFSTWNEQEIRHSAAALGYGPDFVISERSPTNRAFKAMDAWSNPNGGSHRLEVRKVAKFSTIAAVQAVDGEMTVVIVAGGEVGYEDTARMALELALVLVKNSTKVPGAATGGVFSPAAGWGDALLDALTVIGLRIEFADWHVRQNAHDLVWSSLSAYEWMWQALNEPRR